MQPGSWGYGSTPQLGSMYQGSASGTAPHAPSRADQMAQWQNELVNSRGALEPSLRWLAQAQQVPGAFAAEVDQARTAAQRLLRLEELRGPRGVLKNLEGQPENVRRQFSAEFQTLFREEMQNRAVVRHFADTVSGRQQTPPGQAPQRWQVASIIDRMADLEKNLRDGRRAIAREQIVPQLEQVIAANQVQDRMKNNTADADAESVRNHAAPYMLDRSYDQLTKHAIHAAMTLHAGAGKCAELTSVAVAYGTASADLVGNTSISRMLPNGDVDHEFVSLGEPFRQDAIVVDGWTKQQMLASFSSYGLQDVGDLTESRFNADGVDRVAQMQQAMHMPFQSIGGGPATRKQVERRQWSIDPSQMYDITRAGFRHNSDSPPNLAAPAGVAPTGSVISPEALRSTLATGYNHTNTPFTSYKKYTDSQRSQPGPSATRTSKRRRGGPS